jgi:hypothetical protein
LAFFSFFPLPAPTPFLPSLILPYHKPHRLHIGCSFFLPGFAFL